MAVKTDVLVIGGGPIGLHCAYYLLKAGRGVTLLDQAQAGAGSGAGNAGHIVPSHIVPLAAPGVISTALKWMLDPPRSPFGLKWSLQPAYLAWLIRFAAACTETNVTLAIPPLKALGLLSAQLFAEIIAAENFDCSYRTNGLLFLYKTQSAFEAGKQEAEILHRHGLPAEVLEKTAVHEREPAALESVIGGVDFSGDASLDPAHYLRLLKARIVQMGAQVHDYTPVTGLETKNGTITRVFTPTEAFQPALVVLAAGAWSPQVVRGLRLNLPIQPARGYSLTVVGVKNLPRGALLLGERKVAVTPFEGKLRITGRLEIGEMSTVPNPLWIQRIESAAREYIQLDQPLEIEETWAGLRPTTPDGLPIIGFSPRHKNLLLATGHAMLGLSLAPATGQVVANLVMGVDSGFDIRPFRLRWL
ncbi:MAG: FAD-dependent oxidoreductase [Anaerolineae bacterium]|nr:MAG: FAD-dependent oxidoreductase [Anaerolineae bacterium]